MRGLSLEANMNGRDLHGGVERRRFLVGAASAAGLVLCGCSAKAVSRPPRTEGPEDSGEAEVTPGEDLMQEHGVLERILLVYDEATRRLDHGEAVDATAIGQAAGIVRRFVEEYHEKNEEDFVFPRLEAARRETDLVALLRLQHQRGRSVTEEIQRKAGAGPELAPLLRSFVRMYRPHAAREDTVLFPAFRDVVGRNGYRELGDQFEDREHRLFGEHGFETVVAQVADIERAFGVFDLSSFTPPAAT